MNKPTFFFIFHAKPLKSAEKLDDIAGAYISCWIKSDSEQEAEEQARRKIIIESWEILSLEESCLISRSTYEKNSEEIQYYDQAQIDGEVFVYHQWALDGECPESIQ